MSDSARPCNEEWVDTQAQLTSATDAVRGLQGPNRRPASSTKQLFLDMEDVWQMLVKTGVAGVRTKSMVDSELARITG